MKGRTTYEKLFWALCPVAPYSDAEAVLHAMDKTAKKSLPPSINLWLTLIAHIRHQHTAYESLLAQDYDRDAARYFTRDDVNVVLKKWGCRREIEDEED